MLSTLTDVNKNAAHTAEQVIFTSWLVDGTGGPIQSGVWLRVGSGTILSLGSRPPQTMRPGGECDLSGYTLLPGLVDSHVHLTMSGTGDMAIRRMQLESAYGDAAAMIDRHLQQHADAGVVVVRDGGDGAGHVLRFKTRPAVPLAVRVQSAGRAWRQSGRYGRLIGRPPRAGMALEEAVAGDRPRPDHVKIVNSGLNSLTHFARETAPQFSLEEMRAAVEAARARGLGVMVHANGRVPVAMAVTAGVRSVEHGFFMGAENLSRMADSRVIWVPTAVTMSAYAQQLASGSIEAQLARRNFDHQMEQLQMARRLGVRVALGTDAGSLGVHHGTALREEMAIVMAAGWSLPEAVQSGSSAAAPLVGGGYTGIVAPGHAATFIAIKGPPEHLPHSLGRVGPAWVDGRRTRGGPGCVVG